MGFFCYASVLGILIQVRVKEFAGVEIALKSRTFCPLEPSEDSQLKACSVSTNFLVFCFLLISDAILLLDCSVTELSQYIVFFPSHTNTSFLPY